MARQFVYFMQGLSKTYPPNRKVLDNIHLSFYPDAKNIFSADSRRSDRRLPNRQRPAS